MVTIGDGHIEIDLANEKRLSVLKENDVLLKYMFKRPVLFIIWFLIFSAVGVYAFAATVYFKDGKVVEAEIIEKGSYYINVRQGGQLNRFYTDQIERIEEDKVDPASVVGTIKLPQFKDIPPQKIRLIVSLLAVNQTRQQLEKNFKQAIDQAPANRTTELKELFNIDEIMGRLIPIYNRHFDEKELQELIQFYEGPTGQKLLNATPQIMEEAAQASFLYVQEKLKP